MFFFLFTIFLFLCYFLPPSLAYLLAAGGDGGAGGGGGGSGGVSARGMAAAMVSLKNETAVVS